MTSKPYHKRTVAELHTEARYRGWSVGRESKAELVRELNRDDHLIRDRLANEAYRDARHVGEDMP
jgi:hypothetical protein